MASCRGFFVLFLVLGLVLGTGLPMISAIEMQEAAPGIDMSMKVASAEAPLSDMCDKCMKQGLAAHACFSHCATIQAILPAAGAGTVVSARRLTPPTERRAYGSAQPPDLPPPKSSSFA